MSTDTQNCAFTYGMRPFIPVYRPKLPAADRVLPYLRRIDESRIYTNWGPLTIELEQRLAKQFGLGEHAVISASSGTTALVGAILATAGRATSGRMLAVVPALTFVATAIAAEQCGYRPYIVDVDAEDWSLQLGRLEHHRFLSQIGVVVVVAPFGRPVSQSACAAFRERTGIPVVIDGGGSFEGVSADPGRTLGAVPTALSFHSTKSFAVGEGGCVVTTDEQLSSRVMRSLNFGFESSRNSIAPSTNGKLSEYHAAVGLAELDGWAAKHDALLRVAASYRRMFDGSTFGHRLVAAPEIASCYVLLQADTVAASVSLQRDFDSCGVDTRLWYGTGLQAQHCYRELPRDPVDVTENLAPRLIGLPMAPDLSDEAIARIATVLGEASSGSR
jgi:dTDP-4-amino-4,6-dideoxygalactose transaminase